MVAVFVVIYIANGLLLRLGVTVTASAYKAVSLKHDGTDGTTVKMASLPVPSVSDRRDTQTGP